MNNLRVDCYTNIQQALSLGFLLGTSVKLSNLVVEATRRATWLIEKSSETDAFDSSEIFETHPVRGARFLATGLFAV